MRALGLAALACAGCVDFSGLTRDYAPDCPDGALFCDGFEQGLAAWAADPSPDPASTVDLSHQVAHAGTSSLSGAVAPAPSSLAGRNAIHASLAAVSSGTFTARAYVQLPAALGDGAVLLGVGPAPVGGAPAGYFVTLDPSGGWGVERLTAAGTALHPSTPAVQPPLGQWTCLVLQVSLGAAPSHVTLTADHQPVLDFTDATVDAALPSYGALWLGVVGTSASRAEQRYFDDVAVVNGSLDCP